jgi:hypothetical protein
MGEMLGASVLTPGVEVSACSESLSGLAVSAAPGGGSSGPFRPHADRPAQRMAATTATRMAGILVFDTRSYSETAGIIAEASRRGSAATQRFSRASAFSQRFACRRTCSGAVPP